MMCFPIARRQAVSRESIYSWPPAPTRDNHRISLFPNAMGR